MVEPEIYAKTVNHNVVSGFGARPMNVPDKGSSRWGVFSRMVEPAVQISDMDRNGVDINVISTSLVSQSTWWAEPRLAAELDRRANEQIARWVQITHSVSPARSHCRCKTWTWLSRKWTTPCLRLV